MPALTLRQHLKNIRENVKPENCVRTPKQCKDAANKRWFNYFTAKGDTKRAEKYS